MNPDRDTVWTEGTLQQAMAFLVADDRKKYSTYLMESEKLQHKKGSFYQASNEGSTGFGEIFYKWRTLAPTCWYLLVKNKFNALGTLE